MSVIVEIRIPATDFELGRILSVEGLSTIELESLVPVGDATVPLFWIHDSNRESFLENVQEHPSVNEAAEMDAFDGQALFSLDWNAKHDPIFAGIDTHDGQLLSAVGTENVWEFELRFPDHDALGACIDFWKGAEIDVEINRIYNPTESEAYPWYGLTDPQREAMVLAVEMGYYDIPRGCTTKELAAELSISDQAVTERLRRAIATLARQTLLARESDGG